MLTREVEVYDDDKGYFSYRVPAETPDFFAPRAPTGETWAEFIAKAYLGEVWPSQHNEEDSTHSSYGPNPYDEYTAFWYPTGPAARMPGLSKAIIGAVQSGPEFQQAVQQLPEQIRSSAQGTYEGINRYESPLYFGNEFLTAVAFLAAAAGGAALAAPAAGAGEAGAAGAAAGAGAGAPASSIAPAAIGATPTTLAPVGTFVPEAAAIGGGVAGGGAGVGAAAGGGGAAAGAPAASISPIAATPATTAPAATLPASSGVLGTGLTAGQLARLGQAGVTIGGTVAGAAGGGGDGGSNIGGDFSVHPDQEALLRQIRQLALASGRHREAQAREAQIQQQEQANASQQELLTTLRPQIQQLRDRLQATFRAAGRLGPGGGGQVERAERQGLGKAGEQLQALLAAAPGTGLGNLLSASRGFRPFTLAELPQLTSVTQENPAQFGDVAGGVRGAGQLYDAFAPATSPLATQQPTPYGGGVGDYNYP